MDFRLRPSTANHEAADPELTHRMYRGSSEKRIRTKIALKALVFQIVLYAALPVVGSPLNADASFHTQEVVARPV